MKREAIVACSVLGIAAVGVAGCSSQVEPPPPPPAFDPGTAQVRNPIAYPSGPYGVGKGSTIANFEFVGYANAAASTATMQAISLGDFYNPHWKDPSYHPATAAEDDRLFPPGSQYGEGTPKPTVLAIDVASMWCGPCNLEAKCVMPGNHAKYAPCGGGIFLQLQDGNTPGTPALPKDLVTWAQKEYKEDFPTAIDPEARLMALAAADAFPANLIIATETMQIVEIVAGVPDDTYWAEYEKLLPDPSCPAKQTVPPKAVGCP